MSTSTRAIARKKSAVKKALNPESKKGILIHAQHAAPSTAQLKQIARSLIEGAVAIFPTETVYGIGTSAFSPQGIRAIYALKGRTWRKPLALLVSSLEAAAPLVEEIPREAFKLAKVFCPGPLTLVLRASALGRLVTGGSETMAVRIPDHPIALALLKQAGLPLATTSVNKSGDEPAVSGEEAYRLFGARVAWSIDGGRCRIKEASSVIDVSAFPFSVKREGAIPKKDLERVLFGK